VEVIISLQCSPVYEDSSDSQYHSKGKYNSRVFVFTLGSLLQFLGLAGLRLRKYLMDILCFPPNALTGLDADCMILQQHGQRRRLCHSRKFLGRIYPKGITIYMNSVNTCPIENFIQMEHKTIHSLLSDR
jgi:hypothetical protein